MGSRDLRRRLFLVSLSILIGAVLMALKFYAYNLTRSSAILSDALESIINVVASTFAMGSILLAARPPDESHPYGHGKIEFFSAGFEGALIIVAALGIFKTGIPRLFEPTPLEHLSATCWQTNRIHHPGSRRQAPVNRCLHHNGRRFGVGVGQNDGMVMARRPDCLSCRLEHSRNRFLACTPIIPGANGRR